MTDIQRAQISGPGLSIGRSNKSRSRQQLKVRRSSRDYYFMPRSGPIIGVRERPARTSCTPTLSQQGSSVLASRNAPQDEGFNPRSCKNVGTFYGKGRGFGEDFISNEQLAAYEITDLRNKAAAAGATFVQYDSPQFGQDMAGGTGKVTSATAPGRPIGERASRPCAAARVLEPGLKSHFGLWQTPGSHARSNTSPLPDL